MRLQDSPHQYLKKSNINKASGVTAGFRLVQKEIGPGNDVAAVCIRMSPALLLRCLFGLVDYIPACD